MDNNLTFLIGSAITGAAINYYYSNNSEGAARDFVIIGIGGGLFGGFLSELIFPAISSYQLSFLVSGFLGVTIYDSILRI